MRSILAKILLWSVVTFVCSLFAFWAIARATRPAVPLNGGPFPRLIAMVEDDACRAYEEGGPERLAAYLRRLDGYLRSEHLLTDTEGRDLVSGANRSDLLRLGRSAASPRRRADGRFVFVGRPRHGRYRFISIVRPWYEPPSTLPYYAVIGLVVAVMGAILAVHLATPLRRLKSVVEQFGRGDLSARARSTRMDEIGELSRAFDEMAGRLETLLTAERRLLQDVSHELRSPLARLGFAVELARNGAEREASLARVEKEADRMAALIGELLQLTRVEGDSTAANSEEVSLHSLLDGIVRDCDLEAEARGCRLTLCVDRPAVLRGEREVLRRAFENVVRNAIRHTPVGTSVDVSLDLRGDLAAIVVRDHGTGVPDALLKEIFKPFFRVEDDRSRESGGVGLGLAIARRAISLHHGRMISRNASPGLVIAIDLPHAREADPAQSSDDPGAEPGRLVEDLPSHAE